MIGSAEISVSIKLFDENGNQKSIFPPENIVIEKRFDPGEKTDDEIQIAAGASDVAQSLGLVDAANLLCIFTDQDISYKKNSNSGEIQYIKADKISGNTKYGIALLTTSGITSLYFSNAGSNTAKVMMLAVV